MTLRAWQSQCLNAHRRPSETRPHRAGPRTGRWPRYLQVGMRSFVSSTCPIRLLTQLGAARGPPKNIPMRPCVLRLRPWPQRDRHAPAALTVPLSAGCLADWTSSGVRPSHLSAQNPNLRKRIEFIDRQRHETAWPEHTDTDPCLRSPLCACHRGPDDEHLTVVRRSAVRAATADHSGH